MTFRGRIGAILPLVLALAACNSERQPAPEPALPGPAPAQSAAPLQPKAAAPALPPGASVIPAEVVEAPPAEGGPVDAAVSSTPAEPALRDADGGALPQTRATPSVDSALFRYHVKLLFQAIQKDDPSIAMPFFFPVLAYQQVKDIQKPERDWKRRLVAAYERTVHQYHRRLGDNPERAELLGIDVPEKRARWMKPGSEGNKLGYYRVLRSRLRYRTADGKEQAFEVTSFISWRGEWYLVHLHGFK